MSIVTEKHILRQKIKNNPFGLFFIWCPGRDLNSHDVAIEGF